MEKWLQQFKGNAGRTLEFTKDTYALTDPERAKITSSIQAFQRGESSEGRTVIEMARVRGLKPDHLEALKFLIREENRHSAYLRSFMQDHGIPLSQDSWTDPWFRRIRKLAGVELSLRVLVSAEIIALTYYDTLSRATGSPKLARICERMVTEERMHVEFQMQTIHGLAQERSQCKAWLFDRATALLFSSACAAVWIEHRAVLSQEFTFPTFFKKSYGDFAQAMSLGRAQVRRTVAPSSRKLRVLDQDLPRNNRATSFPKN